MPRTTRKPWSVAEKGQLKGYFEQAASTPAWNELAERLGTGRTGKQVQAMAAKLKLTEPVGRTAARGPAWDAQRCRRALDKNTKRKRASPAAASPVHDEPPRSPDKRAAADVARNRIQMQVASPGESPTKRPPVLHESAKRNAIACQFVYGHKQPSVEKWFGKDGTIKQILTEISWLPNGSWGTVHCTAREAGGPGGAGDESPRGGFAVVH